MNVVKVKRTERNSLGAFMERTMTLKQSVWDRVRKENHPHVKWDLLASTSDKPVEKQLMPASEKVEAPQGTNYSNYSLAELKEAAKNAGISGYAIMAKAKLIEKLTENDNSNSN